MGKSYIYDEEGNVLDLRDKAVVVENMDYLSLNDVPWFNNDEQLVEVFIQMDKDNFMYASESLKEKFKGMVKAYKKGQNWFFSEKQQEREEELCF